MNLKLFLANNTRYFDDKISNNIMLIFNYYDGGQYDYIKKFGEYIHQHTEMEDHECPLDDPFSVWKDFTVGKFYRIWMIGIQLIWTGRKTLFKYINAEFDKEAGLPFNRQSMYFHFYYDKSQYNYSATFSRASFIYGNSLNIKYKEDTYWILNEWINTLYVFVKFLILVVY